MTDLVPPLQRLFGFAEFRPGQERVVEAAVAGRDTLALMPTGSGKSLTYQLAAMLRPTPTLVLSPLIALMKDQLDKLPPAVAEQATLINSSLDPDEAARRLRDASQGRYKLLYVAPERLRQRSFLEAIVGIDIGLVVIDEVHCVSMWGHDFRPDYLFIRRALDSLARPAILGMTATATPSTEREIAAALGREPEVVRTSVVRPNLRYDVEPVEGEEGRLRVLVRRLRALNGASAIVYARSRRSCESLARTLRVHDLDAVHYHAGLEPDERSEAQEAFIEGRVQTVVATTAFGMGIDKPDIRLVALYNYPESLESYVQMIGRAGRDGRASDTVLLASRADAQQLRRFARSDIPSVDELRAVYARLRGRAEVLPGGAAAMSRIRACWWGCWSRPASRGAASTPAARCRSRCRSRLPMPPLGSMRCWRGTSPRRSDAPTGSSTSPRRGRAVTARSPSTSERSSPATAACATSARRSRAPMTTAPSASVAPLPDDIAGAVHAAVLSLRWPLGRTGLTAMLRGSLSAPRSAQRSPHFGLLAAASQSDVRRWLQLLELAGALESVRERGRLPARAGGAGRGAATHRCSRDGDARREALRAPARVAAGARAFGRGAGLRRPPRRDATRAGGGRSRTSERDLASVKGFGPAKLERYAADVLAVISASAG